MYCVPEHRCDDRRRQYDIPSARSPKTLSPEIQEVLHMLKALEGASTDPVRN